MDLVVCFITSCPASAVLHIDLVVCFITSCSASTVLDMDLVVCSITSPPFKHTFSQSSFVHLSGTVAFVVGATSVCVCVCVCVGVAQLVERRTDTSLTQVRFTGAARDISPRVNFQCRLSFVCPYIPVCNHMH